MSDYVLNLPSQLKQQAEELSRQQGVSFDQFVLWAIAEKVGALTQGLDDPNFPNITYRRGAGGQPTPVLRGTGIRVQTVAICVNEWGASPAQTATDYDLPETRIKEALEFYRAHRAEVDAASQAEAALEAAHA